MKSTEQLYSCSEVTIMIERTEKIQTSHVVIKPHLYPEFEGVVSSGLELVLP